MSELIRIALYLGLGLPVPPKGVKLSAKYNQLTSRIDGNLDSNKDGKIDEKDKNGEIEECELLAEVFNNREHYQRVISLMRMVGLEDPMAPDNDINGFIKALIEKFQPKSDLDKITLICRAFVPNNKTFNLGGKTFRGIPTNDGGLEIRYNDDPKFAPRREHGSLLPEEIFKTPAGHRGAYCLEMAYLLTKMLSAAGIKAGIQELTLFDHVVVIAYAGKNHYLIDLTVPRIENLGAANSGDRLEITPFLELRDHYQMSVSDRLKAGEVDGGEKDFEVYKMMLSEEDPNLAALLMSKRGEKEEANKYLEQKLADELRKDKTWITFAYYSGIYANLENWRKALENIDRAIEVSTNKNVLLLLLEKKYRILKQSGNVDAAEKLRQVVISRSRSHIVDEAWRPHVRRHQAY